MIAPEGAGYGFVPLSSEVRRVARPHAALDRRAPGTWSGQIELVLTTEQPVHVGAGAKALEGGAIVRKAAVVHGGPGLPGSTLKGVLRSRFEAITRSCALGRPRSPAKVLSQSYPDIKRARIAARLQQSSEIESMFADRCRPGGAMCPACALFGCMGMRGRVSVCDFLIEEGRAFVIHEMPAQFAPRLHHVGRAQPVTDPKEPGGKILEVTSLHGRKFASGRGPVAPRAGLQKVETIPGGSIVRGVLRVWCLTPDELGGLLSAMGRLPESALKIGAGKGHGFGRARVTGVQLRLKQSAGTVGTGDEAGWRKAFDISPDRFAAGEAALVALHQGDI